MGYSPGLHLCHGVDVTTRIKRASDGIEFAGMEWIASGGDCYYMASNDNPDSDEPVDNLPYIVSDQDRCYDNESAFILTFGPHLSTYNGNMSFDEFPTQNWDAEAALALGITELPRWHILIPMH